MLWHAKRDCSSCTWELPDSGHGTSFMRLDFVASSAQRTPNQTPRAKASKPSVSTSHHEAEHGRHSHASVSPETAMKSGT